MRNKRQEGEDSKADVNESPGKEHSINPLDPDESQRSRKRGLDPRWREVWERNPGKGDKDFVDYLDVAVSHERFARAV